MLDKIGKVVARYDEIERQMSDPQVLADHIKLTELAQERAEMIPLVESYQRYQKLSRELDETRDLIASEDDPEMVELATEEIEQLSLEIEALDKKMRSLLVPKDPRPGQVVTKLVSLALTCCACTRVTPRHASGRHKLRVRTGPA